MKFLHPSQLERNREYWKINNETPGLHIDPGGEGWPDFLGCGFMPPSFFVSEKVISSLQHESITFARATAIPIGDVASKALKLSSSPKYFVLEASQGMEIDYLKSGIPTDSLGKPILSPLPKPWPPAMWWFKLASWTGADLFGWPSLDQRTSTRLLCTERIVELAERDGWTNVKFNSIGVS